MYLNFEVFNVMNYIYFFIINYIIYNYAFKKRNSGKIIDCTYFFLNKKGNNLRSHLMQLNTKNKK